MFVKKIPIEEALINAYLEEWVLISDTPSEGPNAIEAPMFQKTDHSDHIPWTHRTLDQKEQKLRRRTSSRRNEWRQIKGTES